MEDFQEIVIKDVRLKVDIVKILLKFIYSDFKNVADINSHNVWNVIYAGLCNFTVLFKFKGISRVKQAWRGAYA